MTEDTQSATIRALSDEIDTLEKLLQETKLTLCRERNRRISLERAWRMVQDAIATVQLDTIAANKASAGVRVLKLNTRAYNALYRAKTNTIAELLRFLGPDPENWPMLLRRLRGISRENAQDIVDALCEYMDVHKLLPAERPPARVLDPIRQVYVRNEDAHPTFGA